MVIDSPGGTNVVSLALRKLQGLFPAVSEVEAYWQGLRIGGLLPRRADVDPRGIERALSHAFMLERIAPRIARFRLAGAHLADLMGMELRGMPVSALFAPDTRDGIGDAIETSFQSPAVVTIEMRAEAAIGRGKLEARMILLPLIDDEGRISRLLGALEAHGHIGRQPRRFAQLQAHVTSLAIAAETPVMMSRMPEHGLAEPARPYRGKDRAHLRLVRSEP